MKMRKMWKLNFFIFLNLIFCYCSLVSCSEINVKRNAAIDNSNRNFQNNQQRNEAGTTGEQQQQKFIEYPLVSRLNENEFLWFEKSFQNLKNPHCRRDLNATLWGIVQGSPWAVAMFDSSVKVPEGVEAGSTYQMGNFDECINAGNIYSTDPIDRIENSNNGDNNETVAVPSENSEHYYKFHSVRPKYCLADVNLEGYKIRATTTRHNKPSNSTLIHWGICVPASCTEQDIEEFMRKLFGYEVHLDEKMCYMKKDFEPTKGMIIYGCIILAFVLMALVCTFYHLATIYLSAEKQSFKKRNEILHGVLKSFSIIENLKKLFQRSKDNVHLHTLNGIKAILMSLVIVGHALLFIAGGPVQNTEFIAKDIKKVQNAFLINSVLFVDTFLLLSGFLFCRILLMELERRKGKVNVFILYVFRYVRLTPAYLAVIAFYMTWFPKSGMGPLWNSKIVTEQERCQKSWWLNLLYINNYVGTENLCMFQSWYLSVDTQLFIIAPIVIYLLWKNRRMGIYLLSSLLIITGILPFVITFYQNLDPTLMTYSDEISDISTNTFFTSVYIKTHMRATGYVFGLLAGFLLHYIQENGVQFPRRLVQLLWVASFIMGTISMFSVTIFYNRNFTTMESALYAGLHRVGWSFANGWLVLAVTSGNSGFLKPILSSRFFAPLSRLAYCAYLTNGIVELYYVGSIRSSAYLSHINLLSVMVGHATLTLLSAIFLCLLFESPIHGIERIFLKRDRQRKAKENQNSNNNNNKLSSSSLSSSSGKETSSTSEESA